MGFGYGVLSWCSIMVWPFPNDHDLVLCSLFLGILLLYHESSIIWSRRPHPCNFLCYSRSVSFRYESCFILGCYIGLLGSHSLVVEVSEWHIHKCSGFGDLSWNYRYPRVDGGWQKSSNSNAEGNSTAMGLRQYRLMHVPLLMHPRPHAACRPCSYFTKEEAISVTSEPVHCTTCPAHSF